MGEKLDDSHQSVNDDEKDVDEQATGALNDSGSGIDDGILDISDRRILSPQHNFKPDGFFVRVLKVIFYIPMKILSIFGISLWQNNLQVSGDPKIDKSPLRPASASPQKRKRDDLDESPSLMDDDEEEDDGQEEEKKKDMLKILEEAVEGYESGEDKDFKPEDQSSCSEEYTEGDTETDLSKLSIEDVSEPRPSAYRNMTEIDQDDVKNKEKKQVHDAVTIPTKCIDEPISKPELTPATVGVVG
ncbi:nucleolin-like [Lytechinus pictus]|uniref:nucleolin-like n=1 Tax=Lytechinus pictus TaxID=7653 RepID=UPI0030B9F347